MLAALLANTSFKLPKFKKPNGTTTKSATEAVLAWQAFNNEAPENEASAQKQIRKIRRVARKAMATHDEDEIIMLILSII